MKKLIAAMVVFSLLAVFPGPVKAAGFPGGMTDAAQRMHGLGLIQGRNPNAPDDMDLYSYITRAEFVTLIVRAFGLQDAAKQLRGVPAFPDSAGHWASGEIAMAKSLIEHNGFTLGMDDGTFDPDGQVTIGQAVAFMVKFLGIRFKASDPWPTNFFDAAVNSGFMAAADRDTFLPDANRLAWRGLVFYLMDTGFYNYKLPGGKTVYTKYVKPNPPTISVNPLQPTADGRVIVTGQVSSDATGLYVNGAQATVNSLGKYSATVSPVNGGVVITAGDLAGNVSSRVQKLAISTSIPAYIDAPENITVGVNQSIDLPIVVRDDKGNPVEGVPFTVISDLGDYVNGQFKAGLKAGSGTAIVTTGDLSLSIPVTVVQGSAARVQVTPASVDMPVGANQKFTAAVFDQYDNPVAADSIAWTVSKGVISGDGTFAATLDAVGEVTVTASAAGLSGSAKINVYGVGTKIAIANPGPLVANGASRTTLTATVQDTFGNTVRNYEGSLRFTSTRPDIATLSNAVVKVTDGTAKVDLIGGSVDGATVILATADGLDGATVTVNIMAPIPTSVQLAADPPRLAADSKSQTTVTAVILDQTGSPMQSAPTGAWELDLANDNTQVVGPGKQTAVAMAYNTDTGLFQGSADFTAGLTLGTANITATVRQKGAATGLPTASVSVSTVVIGPPVRLAIDPVRDAMSAGGRQTTQKVVVRVLDSNGNQVTGAGSDPDSTHPIADLMLIANSGSPVLPATVGHSNAGAWSGGKAVFNVTDPRAEMVVYTAMATYGDTTLRSDLASAYFRAGPPSRIVVTADPSVLSATNAAQGSLTAKITDDAGNPVSDGSYAITFTRTSSAPYAVSDWSDTTVGSVGGVAVVPITASHGAGVDQFTASATINDQLITSGLVSVTTTEAVGSAKQLRFAPTPQAVVGTPLSIRVMIYDEDGALVVTYDNSTNITLAITDPARVTRTYSGRVVNGIASFPVTFTLAGNYTLKATSPGLRGATGSSDNGAATQVMVPGPARALKLVSNIPTLAADNVSTATITAALVDDYGNTTNADSNMNLDGIAFTSSNPSVADLVGDLLFYKADGYTRATDPADKAVVKAVFKAGNGLGLTIITGRKSGLTDGSVTLTTVFGGFVARQMEATVTGPTKATVDLEDLQLQRVTVDLVDASSNRVTNPGPGVFARLVAAGSPTIRIYLDDGAGHLRLYDDTNRPQYTPNNAGEVIFYVTDQKAETVSYRTEVWSAPAGGIQLASVTPYTTTGDFIPNDPAQVILAAAPNVLKGNGISKTLVTAIVADKNGNPIPDVTGNIRMQIQGDVSISHASIQNADESGWYVAGLTDGRAQAYIQSKLVSTTADVYVAAEYWAEGDDVPTATSDPAKVVTVGSNDDNTPPTVVAVSTVRQYNGYVTSGDKFIVTFSERTNAPALTKDAFAPPLTKTLGNATVAWDDTGMVMTVTVGDGVNLEQGDTVRLTAAAGSMLMDQSANPFGSGILFTVDVVAPTVNVTATRNVPGVISPGDLYQLTFSEPVKSGNINNNSFTISGGHTFGTDATFTWDPGRTVLTITTGTGVNLLNGDNIAFATADTITDRSGNPVGTSSFYRIDLNRVVVSAVRVTRAVNNQFGASDNIAITFTRPTNGPAMTPADFIITDGHSLGVGATFTWDPTKTILTLKGANGATIVTGDTIRLAQGSKIRDTGGNAYGIGPLITVDLTAPRITSVVINRAANNLFQANDSITVTFSEPTNAPTLTNASFQISGGHNFGGAPRYQWDSTSTILTITGGGVPSIMNGDTIAFASPRAVMDAVGNGVGTDVFLSVDLTAPAVTGVTVNRITNNQFSQGDTITLIFSKTTNKPNLTPGDFVIGNGHNFGTNPSFSWNADGTMLFIGGGGTPTLHTGDTIAFAQPKAVTDLVGNGIGTDPVWTTDLAAPAVANLVVRRVVNNAFAAGDTITITFNKPTTAPDLIAGDFRISNGHDFGPGATFKWDQSRTVLTITGAGVPSLQTDDTVAFAGPSILQDSLGNGFGTDPIFTADLTAPAILDGGVMVRPKNGVSNGVIEAGDQIVITFSKQIVNPPVMYTTDFTLTDSQGNSHSLGDEAGFTWSGDGTQLTITLGTTNLTMADGDLLSITPMAGATIKDHVGNPVGGVGVYTVVRTQF